MRRRCRVKWLWEIHVDPSKAELHRRRYSNGTGKRGKGLAGGLFGGNIEIYASVEYGT